MMLEALRNELAEDPLRLGYAPLVASGNDAALADMLNEEREGIHVHQLVERATVKTLLFGSGEMLKLSAASSSEAISARMYLSDPDYVHVDLSLPVVQGMIAKLLEQEVLSQATVDAIQDMGVRPGSRAEQLGLGEVTFVDVARAVRDESGNPLIGG